MGVHIQRIGRPLIDTTTLSGRHVGGESGPTVAAVSGDLDAVALPTFRRRIDQAINSAAAHTVIVDLSRVGFVSISAVLALADAQDRACRSGVALLLVSPARPRVLNATGLAAGFNSYSSVRAAIEARRAELAAHLDLEVPANPGDWYNTDRSHSRHHTDQEGR